MPAHVALLMVAEHDTALAYVAELNERIDILNSTIDAGRTTQGLLYESVCELVENALPLINGEASWETAHAFDAAVRFAHETYLPHKTDRPAATTADRS